MSDTNGQASLAAAAADHHGIRISVVIPTYNAAQRLARTIATVRHQTAPAHEVIVVDDGSTDATPQACAGFGARDRVLRVPNGGQQHARNLGVEAATGDWVALLDHDDLWDPTTSPRPARSWPPVPWT